MLNTSKDEKDNLPKLHFKKRSHTTLGKRDKSRQALSTRLLSNNGEMKRTFSANKTLASIKYETTGLLYSKKTEQLEKQNKILDQQIKTVQQQIKQIRKIIANNINKDQASRVQRNTFLTQPIQNINNTEVRQNNKLTNEKSLTNEIKICRNRIQLLRKKRDEYNQRNQKHKKQINQLRKQIITYKNLCKNSLCYLQKLNQQNLQYLQLFENAEQQLKSMNAMIQKAKKEHQQNKAQNIKKYDNILKCLKRQLNQNSNTKSAQMQENLLYLTEIANLSTNSFRNSKLNRNQSPIRTNYHHKIEAIKQKLQDYEREFQYLKKTAGVQNTQQAVKKFQNKYQKNFRYYKFINQLYQSYEQKQKQNNEMWAKKQQLFQQINSNISHTKYQEIINIRSSIEHIRSQKLKYSAKNQQFAQFKEQLMGILKQFSLKMNINNLKSIQTISQQNISSILQQIKNRCHQLDSKFQQKSLMLDLEQGQTNLGQMLQSVQKQGSQETKNEKIMSRQDFIQLKEKLMRKKTHSRKTISKR